MATGDPGAAEARRASWSPPARARGSARPGLADAAPWDNRDATAAKSVPRRLVVLGGGAVGVEMAQAFRRLGTEQVTVLEVGPRLLPREEPFAGDEVRAALEAEGVTVVLSARPARVERRTPDGEVRVELGDGGEIRGDELLVAAGRRAATDELGLDTVGLQPGAPSRSTTGSGHRGRRRLALRRRRLQRAAPLTHMGKYQARIAGDVISGKDVRDRASETWCPG